jgi:hypothetical protein
MGGIERRPRQLRTGPLRLHLIVVVAAIPCCCPPQTNEAGRPLISQPAWQRPCRGCIGWRWREERRIECKTPRRRRRKCSIHNIKQPTALVGSSCRLEERPPPSSTDSKSTIARGHQTQTTMVALLDPIALLQADRRRNTEAI